MLRRLLLLLLLSVTTLAQQPTLSKTVQEYVRVQSPKVILTHVRIIDGTGAPAADDQNIVIESGKIAAIQEGAGVAASPNVAVLDLRGYTVMPGIVGMHNHLYYIARPDIDAQRHFESPVVLPQLTFSAPSLYRAGGVTTMRTTGSVETYLDLNLKHLDAGKLAGPLIDVTGRYTACGCRAKLRKPVTFKDFLRIS